MTDEEVQDTLTLIALNERWVQRFFGGRCPEFDPHCECCKRWQMLELLFRDT